ncbi:MAG: protein-L-isoaspartate(D-aspartate) O-methyltransferase [Solirubrobacterales bacterium]
MSSQNQFTEEELTLQRKTMVREQLLARGIGNKAVLSACEAVPRHRFIPEAYIARAYGDHPLPIGWGQTISQPYIVAYMIDRLSPGPNDRVLEIGTGSGYAAAVISRIASRVFTVERIEALAERASAVFIDLGYDNCVVRTADGTVGWPEEGPFDCILVSAGAPEIPDTLQNQLGPGGRMIIPVGGHTVQELILVTNEDGRMLQQQTVAVRFVPLIGSQGWREE